MSAESLKDRMRDFAEGKIGNISVSGADVSGASAGEQSHGPTQGTVMADVPEAAKRDVFTEASATAQAHAEMQPSFIQEQIDISEEDRDAFLKALVTGGRYEREFEIYGGKIRGTFRCRKIAESDGIIAWLSHCANVKKIEARIEYMTLMRDALLAAQVKRLRGLINEDFPELPTPYAPTRSDDGEGVSEPGWLGLAKSWGERPEALVTAIHSELQKFEKRYWSMVMESGNQNFWNPAASI